MSQIGLLRTTLALLVGGAVLVWGPGVAAAAAQEPDPDEWDGGSLEPCQVPLRWYVEEVDEGFGLTRDEAEDAVRLAGMLWEEAVGRRLFIRDPERGFPVRFLYDERQERTGERLRREAELDEVQREIAEARSRLEALREELDEARRAYEAFRDRHREELEEFRREVEYWNERGGVPDEEWERLQERRAELEEQGRALDRELDGVNRLTDRLNAQAERLNRRITEHNRGRAELREDFPPELVRSGIYRESRRTLLGFTISLEREIEIYQFDDRNHLVVVVAHELGHALGLGHTGVQGSVMVDAAGPRSGDEGRPALHPADLALLRDRCPDL